MIKIKVLQDMVQCLLVISCYLRNFYICTMHLDIIKVYYSPTNAQMIVLKTILKFTLK